MKNSRSVSQENGQVRGNGTEQEELKKNSRSNSRDRSPRKSRSRSHSPKNGGTVLYIGNLSRRLDETDIRENFEKYGRIAEIQVIKDPYTQECRGFAFVRYENGDDATDALALDSKELDGRRIRVEKSKRGIGYKKTPGEYLGHKRSGGRGRRSPSPRYRRRSPRGRGSRDRHSRERSDGRRSRQYDDRRYRSRSRDRYRSRSRSDSRSRRRR